MANEEFASKEHVELCITKHTLNEREYSHTNFASKKYEKYANWVAVAVAGTVLMTLVNVVINNFTENFNSPRSVDTVYEP